MACSGLVALASFTPTKVTEYGTALVHVTDIAVVAEGLEIETTGDDEKLTEHAFVTVAVTVKLAVVVDAKEEFTITEFADIASINTINF